MDRVDIAAFLMRLGEREPAFSENSVGELKEVFNHRAFLDADEQNRRAIMFRSSQSKYDSELDYPWDNYFGFELRSLLGGKTALDLGCFTGGRSIAWLERYGFNRIIGIDIEDEYIQAASQFAQQKGAAGTFFKSQGESLPFEDASFDAVLSFDVFEHVQDVADTLQECRRVLKTGGRLFVVFPSYYHPIEHHLTLATMTPCLHWIFSGETLIKAYCEIIDERGDGAYWYRRSTRIREPWERGNTVNGMTFARFKRILARQNWTICREVHKPIGAIGRSVRGNTIAKLLSALFLPFTFVPGMQELVLHRNTFILEK